MGNYSLVVGSKYSPFTFQELLQPALMATQAHQQLEDQYSELATKAGIWENLANEQTDRDTYEMYKKYSDDLAMQAEQLAREGLTPLSRQNMLNMKRRYSNEIVPIENAYNRRQALIDEQRKGRLADNTIMYNIDASTLSLNDLIKNPQLSYESYSGNLITEQVAKAAKQLSKSIRENPRYWREILKDKLGAQYYETRMKYGYTEDEIYKAISGDASAPKELTEVLTNVIAASPIYKWANPEKNPEFVERALHYGKQGLWAALGEEKYETLQNKGYGVILPDDIPNPNDDNNTYMDPIEVESKVKEDKTSKLKSDINFIEGLVNGSININNYEDATRGKVFNTNFDNATSGINPENVNIASLNTSRQLNGKNYNNLSRLISLYDEYDIPYNPNKPIDLEAFKEIIKSANSRISEVGQKYMGYKLRVTDTDPIINDIDANIKAKNKDSGLRPIKNGEVKDLVGKKESDTKKLKEFFETKPILIFNPEYGMVLSNGSKQYVIDFSLFGDVLGRSLHSDYQAIKAQLEGKRNDVNIGRTVESMGKAIYKYNTTRNKMQSKTDSKLGRDE